MSTHATPAEKSLPAEYALLVDDAAIFPPGNAPLADAVAGYRGHRSAPHAGFVGPFVVSDERLPRLVELLGTSGDEEPLAVSVVVTGGAGALEPAVRWATGTPLLDARGFEVALRDLDDLPGAARRVVAATASAGVEVPVNVEPPLVGAVGSHGWLAALDEVAAGDLRLKFRTGGVTAEAFPTSTDVATAIDAALDRELPFKCTAGLHHAVRHRAGETGFEHHGFLNVLLAVRAALDGDDVSAVLEEQDAATVLSRVHDTGGDGLVRARRWFTSFGCCGVTEPFEELIALGLVAPPPG